jgi:hypothetical protein
MRIGDMINRLEKLRSKYGDLKIVGGYLSDDFPPTEVIVLNTDGTSHHDYPDGQIEGAYIK